jgi:hypothetical protein
MPAADIGLSEICRAWSITAQQKALSSCKRPFLNYTQSRFGWLQRGGVEPHASIYVLRIISITATKLLDYKPILLSDAAANGAAP